MNNRSTPMRWLSLILAWIAIPAHAFDPVRAEGLLREALATDGGPGIQVAVMHRGELVWSAAVGHADLEQQVPLTSSTRLRIGSVSKLYTATLVARLIQADRMRPDSDVREYVPEFPDKGAPITLRRLASHTSGIRHYDFSNLAEANNTNHYHGLPREVDLD